MVKITMFNGSPRVNGCSSRLLEQVKLGAESKGAVVSTFQLNAPGIRGCQGCLYCRKHDGCATKDVFWPVYKEIKEADAVVLAAPIYCGQISGQAKIWLDRMFPMLGEGMIPRYPGKKFVTIYSQGKKDETRYMKEIEGVNDILRYCGWDMTASILSSGSNAEAFSHTEDILGAAYEAGERLALV